MAQSDIIQMLLSKEYVEVAQLPNARRTFHVTGNSIYAINTFGECIQLHCTGDEVTIAKATARNHFAEEVFREQRFTATEFRTDDFQKAEFHANLNG